MHIRTATFLLYFKHIDPRIIVALLSILLYLYAISVKPFLSADAYIYLKAVEIFNTEGIQALSTYYGWPGYPLLIAFADRVLPFGPIFAAHTLIASCYALLCASFITLVCEYRESPGLRLKIIAAIVIVAFPEISELRPTLLRDSGMWSFGILSLVFLIRFNKSGRIIHALGWAGSLLLATVFRLESLIFLAFGPVTLLLSNSTIWLDRIKKAALLYLILLAALLLGIMICYLININIIDNIRYAYRAYIPEIFNYLNTFDATAREMGNVIFDDKHFSGDFQTNNIAVLALAYIYSYLLITLKALGGPLSILLAFGLIRKHIRIPASVSGPLLGYMVLAGLYLFVFMVVMHFLVQRYADFLAILLMSVIAIIVEHIISTTESSKKLKKQYAFFSFFAFYLFIESTISFGASQQYLADAMRWPENNVPESSNFYTNNRPIAYFSGKIDRYDLILKSDLRFLEQLEAGDYIGVEIRDHETELRANLSNDTSLELVKTFSNEKDDAVMFFQKISN